jgi:CDP-diacylglycerol--glycerol-3-phosphate 3-phosphatidyltransferase
MLSRRIGQALVAFRDCLAGTLVRANIPPNLLTVLGLVCNLAAGGALAFSRLYSGLFLMIVSSFFDSLDGAVAKIGGRVTPFGGFLDSTLDRYSDAAVLGGLMVHFLRQGRLPTAALAFSTLVGSFVISYVRARAENFIPSCRVGYWERGERVTYVMVGLLWGRVDVVMWVLGILVHWTALQRILHTRFVLERGEPYRPKSILMRSLYWDWPRGTIAYDVFTVSYTMLPIVAALYGWVQTIGG